MITQRIMVAKLS